MRLTFPNGEHANVDIVDGETMIGSGVDNAVVLAGSGLPLHHASVVRGPGGLRLRVAAGAPTVHVNARPVRKLAWLRAGDLLSFDHIQALLLDDAAAAPVQSTIPDVPPPAMDEAARMAAARVVLRGVAGAHFGRSYALDVPRVIGRGATADIRIDDPSLAERHAQLELHGDRVVLRQLGRGDGSVLNGVAVRDAVLAPGDQLAFEQHRFVLEAPGLAPRSAPTRSRPTAADAIVPADMVPTPPRAGRTRTALWLIVAAIATAAALLVLLVYAPQLAA